MIRFRASVQKVNGWKLVVAAIVAGLLIATALFARSWQTAEHDREICEKVDRVVLMLERLVVASSAAPSPGDYGYSYFRAHPQEALSRPRLTRSQLMFLRSAACDPASLPPIPDLPGGTQ